jgi:hypothetical protein
MKHHRRGSRRAAWLFRFVSGCAVVASCAVMVGCGESGGGDSAPTTRGPSVEGGPVALRRLTSQQFGRSIHDVLGEEIVVPSRVEPDARREGLLGVGASFVSVTPSGFEKYEAAATSIAEQALGSELRGAILACEPSSASGADDACAREFITTIGRRLFRRSLTEDEVAVRVAVAAGSADELGDFYAGLQMALTSLLVSPNFLFRVEEIEPDPADASRLRLTSTSVATRLSYLIWDSTPDDELLDAAETGGLLDVPNLTSQVTRLLESPKAEAGIRAFFSDLLTFRSIDEGLVRKSPTDFPAFTLTLAGDAKEQTLRTIVDHLVTNERDLRELYTTRNTFLTPSLGSVYAVPFGGGQWGPYEFAGDGPRAGLLSHVSLLAITAHPGRSSATLRGKFVREVLLCQTIPDPPANVDFSIVENTDGEIRTARQRLGEHVTNDACAGCHQLMDPIGLAFENFDAIGAFRAQENGVTIDASGELDGQAYDDAIGMGQALHDHPALGPCMTSNLYRYAVGREPVSSEDPLMVFLNEQFATSDYQWGSLIETLVLSDGFLTASGQREAEEAAQ